MSGEWVGYFSHRAPASEGGGAAMQFASMQIELSDDGDAILGSGADGLGSFELQRGRRAVDVTPHSVEFSKVYTAVQAGYAPLGDAADGAAVEVFCEGTVEPRTSCIRGEWHMAFRFSGKAYREVDRGPQRSGGGLGDSFKNKPAYKEGDELFWCDEQATPLPLSEVQLRVKQPELWEWRHKLIEEVDDGTRLEHRKRRPALSHLSPPRSSLYRSMNSWAATRPRRRSPRTTSLPTDGARWSSGWGGGARRTAKRARRSTVR